MLVCYIRKYVKILVDIPTDVLPTKNIGGCVPGIPGVLTPVRQRHDDQMRDLTTT